MTLAAYAATGFVVAGIHAFMLRRDRDNRFHKAALAIALVAGAVLLFPSYYYLFRIFKTE